MHLINFSLILFSLALRYIFQKYVLENPIHVPSANLEKIFEESGRMQEIQQTVNGYHTPHPEPESTTPKP